MSASVPAPAWIRLAAIALGIGVGCAQAPVEELGLAEARVERARRAQAASFAPDPFDSAQSALAEARRHLRQGSGSSHRAALRAAAAATREADAAYRQASVSRAIVARRAARLLREIESLLEMAAARAGGSVPEELEALRARYAEIEATATLGDWLDALAQGEALKPVLLDLERRLRP